MHGSYTWWTWVGFHGFPTCPPSHPTHPANSAHSATLGFLADCNVEELKPSALDKHTAHNISLCGNPLLVFQYIYCSRATDAVGMCRRPSRPLPSGMGYRPKRCEWTLWSMYIMETSSEKKRRWSLYKPSGWAWSAALSLVRPARLGAQPASMILASRVAITDQDLYGPSSSRKDWAVSKCESWDKFWLGTDCSVLQSCWRTTFGLLGDLLCWSILCFRWRLTALLSGG